MAQLQLRLGEPADAPALMALHYAAVHQSAVRSYSMAVLDAWSPPDDRERVERLRCAIANGEELVVVALLGDRIVGFGSLVTANNELRAIYVHPRNARTGVGSALLQRLQEAAKAAAVPHLEMDASLNAERFYSSHGFRVVSRGVHRLNSGVEMACVRMRKIL